MWTPLPIGFMLCHPFSEFILIYNHNVSQVLHMMQCGIVPKFDIIKDLKKGPDALAHEGLIIDFCAICRQNRYRLGSVTVDNPDQKFAIIDEGVVYVGRQFTEPATVQDKGIAETIAVAGHDLHLQFLGEILQ